MANLSSKAANQETMVLLAPKTSK